MTIKIDAPAAAAWEVLGERFADLSWSPGIERSWLDAESPAVGAVRACESSGFGPFPASVVRERLTLFEPNAHRFAYEAVDGLPRFVRRAANQWSVESTSNGCVVKSDATLLLKWWALPLAPFMSRMLRSSLAHFIERLREEVAGVAHTEQRRAG